MQLTIQTSLNIFNRDQSTVHIKSLMPRISLMMRSANTNIKLKHKPFHMDFLLDIEKRFDCIVIY